MDQGNPLKCYDARFLGQVLVLAGLIVALSFLGRGLERGSALRLAVGGAQGALIAFVIRFTVRAIRRLDELQLRIHLEAIAISFAGTAAMGTAWRFVERAGAPGFDYGVLLWPIMVLLWAVGVAVRRRHYG